jgi:hypothetical protein
MKRILLAILITLSAISFGQDVYIPDTDFLSCLIYDGVDTSGDGLIQKAEANRITEINNPFCNPTDLTGIKSFTFLNKISLNGHSVDSIDLRGLSYLKTINLDPFNASFDPSTETKIYLNNLDSLMFLNCSHLKLDTLDISTNLLLKTINCAYNELSFLDLLNNPEIEELNCSVNNIKEIDVSNNPQLKKINLEGNNILCAKYISQHIIEWRNPPSCFVGSIVPDNCDIHWDSDDMGSYYYYQGCSVPLCTSQIDTNGCTLDLPQINGNLSINNGGSSNAIKDHQIIVEPSGHSVTTDENGYYELILLDTGTYTIWTNGLSQYEFIDSLQTITISSMEDSITVNFMAELLGINDINPSIQASIYPNPINSNEFLNIEVEHGHSYSILNIQGEVLKKAPLSGAQIPLNGINSGSYFILIETDKGSVLERIVVK